MRVSSWLGVACIEAVVAPPPPPPPTYAPVTGKDKKLLLAGGVCLLVSGILSLIWVVVGALWLAVLTKAYEGYGIGFGAGYLGIMLGLCVILPLICGIFAILGGIMAMKAKHFGLAITGAILGMIGGVFTGGFYFLGIGLAALIVLLCLIGMILIILGREKFK